MELGFSIIVPYTIQTCDGGSHRRKDRLNGGLYITEGAASMALSTMQPNETIIVTRRGMECNNERIRIRVLARQ